MRNLVIVVCLAWAPAFAGTLDEARGSIESGSYDQTRAILERGVGDARRAHERSLQIKETDEARESLKSLRKQS